MKFPTSFSLTTLLLLLPTTQSTVENEATDPLAFNGTINDKIPLDFKLLSYHNTIADTFLSETPVADIHGLLRYYTELPEGVRSGTVSIKDSTIDGQLDYVPQLLLSIGDLFNLMQISLPADVPAPPPEGAESEKQGEPTKFKFADPLPNDYLWLPVGLSRDLLMKFPRNELTPLDWQCITNLNIESPDDEDIDKAEVIQDVQPMCCPNNVNLSPPRLATTFLSELYDTYTKLAVFFDELGIPTLSTIHLRQTRRLCGAYTGTELREALQQKIVVPSFESMVIEREILKDNTNALFNRAAERFFKIEEPWKAGDMEWSATPTTMLIGYQNMNDHEAMKDIADGFTSKFGGTLASDYVEGRVKRRKGFGEKKKIKVGVVSSFLRSHSVGRLTIGLIQDLDRDKFEVKCFSIDRFNSEDPIAMR